MINLEKRLLKFGMAIGLGVLLVALPAVTLAVNLLTNGSFEQFQSYGGVVWRGFPEEYGAGWTLKVVYDDGDGLHVMDSDVFGQFLVAVYSLPYLNYHIEGDHSQVFVSRRTYHTVLLQTVSVQTGKDYAFGGKIVSFWKGPDNDIDHTKIFKRIGIDPTGGTDYTGGNVQWTDWDGTDNAWISPALAVTAQNSQATVFIEVNNIGEDVGEAYLNPSYIDSFKFELAPVASLTLPALAPPGSVAVSWDVSIPDSYWNLWGYDVEYKDNSIGIWQTVQTHSGTGGANESFNLTGEAGKIYTVRVRPWQQRAPSGDPATTAMPGVWQEKSVVIGQVVMGQVTTHAGIGLAGVTVAISGTATNTMSANGGNYTLPTGSDGTFSIKADDFGEFVAPPAASVAVTAGGVGQLDITMRPTGAAQGIQNNDFDVDLSGWDVSGSAARSTAEMHTGVGSLLLTGGDSVSQTNVVTDMLRPLLSFWYKTDDATTLTAAFLGPTGTVRSSVLSTATDWTHVTLESGYADSYTGTVGVGFGHSSGGNIYIDEVSIGAGTYSVFLPLILRE